ncbi:DUF2798 domain-containing protein [Bradyrhizobium sediminis]|uniref:DUF2798 domain-containing protein n=1 Tax=Bradyrhizobium sediminis TaxID=2840469 RepID=A0A975NTB2_9BRAD|nr:DUF2798 domain-containing protein [Bradyrhizobium sediminis]QWG20214.1 DUF2798 domain-containing protein [Bradyrhizobium sediminis]
MPKIPRRYAHFLFGVIQSGLTAAVASAVASYEFLVDGDFVAHWLVSWLTSWALMVPIVLVAAPAIRWVSVSLTARDDGDP